MSFFFFLILLLLLIFLSAVCSFAEAVLVGRSAEIIHSLSKNGSSDNKLLYTIMSRKDSLLSVVLLGNNISNSMAASIGAIMSSKFLYSIGVGSGIAVLLNTFVITMITFFFGEVLPKSIALRGRKNIGRGIMMFISVLNNILSLPVIATNWLVNKILNYKPSSKADDASLTQKELKMTVEARHLEGKIFTHYRDMLNGLLNLEDVSVSSIMRYKADVFSIDANSTSFQNVVLDAIKSGYSRFPVYDGSLDNVIGILHIRDIFNFYYHEKKDDLTKEKLLGICNKPLFVTENATLYHQMLIFRKTRSHMAIVIDEFGVFIGVVTLEDILEEIVGEIGDEHDKDEGPDIFIKDGTIILEGDYSVHDLSRRFNIDLQDTDARTVAGLIIERLERLPIVGEKVKMFGYVFSVKGMKQNKITVIEMKKIEENL